MKVKQRKSMAAFTLIEVMAAVLIVTIVVAGGSFLFVMGRSQISAQKRYRAATQLAAQRIEELKAGTYAEVVSDSNTVSLEGYSYTRATVIEDANTYKKSTVTVTWGPAGNQHNVSLVTFIAPK